MGAAALRPTCRISLPTCLPRLTRAWSIMFQIGVSSVGSLRLQFISGVILQQHLVLLIASVGFFSPSLFIYSPQASAARYIFQCDTGITVQRVGRPSFLCVFYAPWLKPFTSYNNKHYSNFSPLSVIWSPPNECNFWLIGFKMLIKHWHRGSRHQVSRVTAAFFIFFFVWHNHCPRSSQTTSAGEDREPGLEA